MTTKQLLITLCVGIGLAFTSQNAISQESKADVINLRLGHVLDAQHAFHKTFLQFAQDVKKDTNGGVEISVVPSSGLGSLDDMVDQLKFGALEMTTLFPVQLSRMDKKFLMDQFPYLWKDLDTAMVAMHGDVGEIYNKLALKQGIKILAYLPTGFRHMTNSVRPIYKPEDLKGLKMRIPNSRLQIETFKLFHVSPTPIVFGELYSALQLKTADGQENPLDTIYTSRFYEVQKYLSLTSHSLTMGTLSYSKNLWEKLPQDVLLLEKIVELI